MYLRGEIMSLSWCGLNHQLVLQLAQFCVLLAFSRDRHMAVMAYGLRIGFMWHARMMCINQSGDLVPGCCGTVNELVWRKLVLARNHCGAVQPGVSEPFSTLFQNTRTPQVGNTRAASQATDSFSAPLL